MIDRDLLLRELQYDPLTGIITKDGSIRGSYSPSFRYGRLGYRGKIYLIHRLIWFYMTGEWPEFIDHVDGDPWNNRFNNLRAVSRSENQRNLKLRVDNKSGVAGVTYYTRDKVWVARIGKRKLGVFKTKELAIDARESDPEFKTFSTRHGK